MLSIGVDLKGRFQTYYYFSNVFLFGGLIVGSFLLTLFPKLGLIVCAVSSGKWLITEGVLLHNLVSEILVCEILVSSRERKLKFGLFLLGYCLSLGQDYFRSA